MRKKEKEITDKKLIEEIIRKATVCRLALCENNIPYIIPLNFGYKNDCLYFHSAQEGKKINIIRQNNNVCFEMDVDTEIIITDTVCNWEEKYYSVIGFGKAYLVEELEEKRKALDILITHYTDKKYEYPEDQLKKVAIIKVEIENMTGKKSGY